jgi:methyl-accepting chemotaxis protein
MKSHIEDRLGFMGLDEAARRALRGAKPALMRELPAALDRFYDRLQQVPEMRAFFANPAAMARAKSRQSGHWEGMADGQFDAGYVDAVVRVGETHARIGLEPRWYIGGYALLLESLIGAVVEARWPKGRLGIKVAPPRQAKAELGALAKAVMLDMDLAISVYLEALEARRLEVEAEAKATNAAVMAAVGEALSRLATAT